MDRIEFQAQNAYLVEKAIEAGLDINTFDGWKAQGFFVKKGSKQQCYRVRAGSRTVEDPLTGDFVSEPVFKHCYAFSRTQVEKHGK